MIATTFALALAALGVASPAVASMDQLETPRLTQGMQRVEFGVSGDSSAFKFRFADEVWRLDEHTLAVLCTIDYVTSFLVSSFMLRRHAHIRVSPSHPSICLKVMSWMTYIRCTDQKDSSAPHALASVFRAISCSHTASDGRSSRFNHHAMYT
jgi:hypothetical protein